MSVKQHRKNLLDIMPENTIALIYSGRETAGNEDEYLPFAVDSDFYYLTDYERAGMALLLGKFGGKTVERIFIEETSEFTERWTGKMPKADEVKEKAQIEDVAYISSLRSAISGIMASYSLDGVYFDTYRYNMDDLPTYNCAMAKEFKSLYPAACIRDLHALMQPLREAKDEDEIERIKKACAVTAKGLENLVAALKPGLKEYQAQAVFEGSCAYEGTKVYAFPTIAATGINACSMHYTANDAKIKDGDLVLFDLGAKYENYCSDVTRTYPANGKYSPRQRAVYELVLKANKAVAEMAKPGIGFADIEKLTCDILGEGLVSLGLLDDPKDVRKYYMHSVSHSIGIDAHDSARRNEKFRPGWVISDEPGLYIDEEGIGIRIEDDLLITEDGCIVLTESIPKDPDVIERLMKR